MMGREGTDDTPLDPTVHPAAADTCDGRDEDCDGLTDETCADP
jgi:hypothetical protein